MVDVDYLDAKLFQPDWSGIEPVDIQNLLGKAFNNQEVDVVSSLITAIEDFISREARRNFYIVDGTTEQYEETFDAGHKIVHTFNLPIDTIYKIQVDDRVLYEKDGENNSYIWGKHFVFYDDRICFISSVPTSTILNANALKICYSIKKFWGEDAKLVVKRWVGEIFTAREYGGKAAQNVNVSGFSINFDLQSSPDYIKTTIGHYRKILI